MSKTWYSDAYAKQVHRALSEELKRIIDKMCPGHELSHVGINRNEETEEIILKLHLNPIGKIKVMDDTIHSELGYSRIGRNNI